MSDEREMLLTSLFQKDVKIVRFSGKDNWGAIVKNSDDETLVVTFTITSVKLRLS